jgi:8-oxo-dGTP diphosphatase
MPEDTKTSDAAEALIRAAGGVVWRHEPMAESAGQSVGQAAGPAVQVLIVHRPRYDDWSLPKGKLDDGESFEDAAVREIAEETGVQGVLGPDLGSVHYTDHKGRPKIVRWWAVFCERQDQPSDTDEVDQKRWLPPLEAEPLLSYDTDRDVLRRFRDTVKN